MTLPEIIYDIKRVLGGGDTPVDSKYLDSHLTQVVNQARAEALSINYMQMREKKSISGAMQDFMVLQNSESFNQNVQPVTGDLESNSGSATNFGSQLYRKLKKYSIESEPGSFFQWNKNEFDSYKAASETINVTDVCSFKLPSPVLTFGRNNGFLSFTDHSFDAIKMENASLPINNNYYDLPGLGGDHVRVVYGLKELRDLQKHKASFPYKRGIRNVATDDSSIIARYNANYLTPDHLYGTSADRIPSHLITFKNPLAVVTNSDIFLNGPNTHDNFDTTAEATAATLGGGWNNNSIEYNNQYNYNNRRGSSVLLIDTPLGKYLTDDVYLDSSKRFGCYLVSGVFSDPTLLPNYNFQNSEYPMPVELLPQLKQNLMANQLMIAQGIEEDLLNDGNNKSRAQSNVQPRQQASGRPSRKA